MLEMKGLDRSNPPLSTGQSSKTVAVMDDRAGTLGSSSQYLRLVVTAATNAPSGTSRGFLVTAISAADTTKRDAVKASVSVK